MASPFKIPKKKQPAGSDSAPLHMQSPLSRLQSSALEPKGYGDQSGRGRADRVHAGSYSGNAQRTPCKPFFTDMVKTLLGLNSPNRGASTTNHRAGGGVSHLSAPGQRVESSSGSFSNRWRPKRASDRLLQPDATSQPLSPPQKRSDLRDAPPLTGSISVTAPDSLAELRGHEHAGSWSSGQRTRRRVESTGWGGAAEGKRQQKKNSGASGDTSEDDFLSPSRPRDKPPADGPGPCDLTDDPREKQRQRWREFREKRMPGRSAVLQLRPRRPRPTPTEPIVLSSEEEEEEEEERGQRCPGGSEQASSSKGDEDQHEPPLPLPPPSFLQLEFTSLHAGLTHADANGPMTVTESGVTIPLKGDEEGEVTVVASQVRGYGVWDGGVARGGALLAGWRGPAPSLLFLWVTDAQANLLQMELSAMQTSSTASGPSCSFLLLVLKEHLQELHAALLASILDMEEYKKGGSISSSSWGLTSPLEWTDGLLLLHSCPPPLDQHLLRLLGHSAGKTSMLRSRKSNLNSTGVQQLPTRLIQYPAAPCKGRITVTKEDLACLGEGEFLNDVIIDFYLKFLLLEGVGGLVPERSHVFSSFFYKQLSRPRAAGETAVASVPDGHMRHRRVKTWTRHVDIFTKDFLFVPINQEAHWYLVVVCFPGLEEVQYQDFERPTGGSELAAGRPSVGLRSQLPPSPECTAQGWRRGSVMKRPCILVMDSLKLSYHENVCKLLRDYLQVEWEVRRSTPRLFTPNSMRSCSCRVPQQDNSSDCGLYLLQYAESFLQNPVVHFDLPLRLDHWFPRQRVRGKRNEIRRLIMRLRGEMLSC